MEWRDEAVLISLRPHGESAAIIEAFTAAHGRHSGVVRGGASRRMAPILQPGSQLDLHWQARLSEHLGVFQAEPLRARAGLMADRRALSCLNSVCALLHLALPEREPHPALWRATVDLLDRLDRAEATGADYLHWELNLLAELGYGLDLSSCAVTGTTEDLAYVSPRTGRAVSRTAGAEWADKLLTLPPFLLGPGAATPDDLAAAMRLTGHFLACGLEPVLQDRPLPEARTRLAALLGTTR